MSHSKEASAATKGFDELKKFDERFLQLFPALDTAPADGFSGVLAVSEAVLNWYLVPVVENSQNSAESCALLIKRLVGTVIGHINEVQRQKIYFSFTREAIGELKATAQFLKIVAEQKEMDIFNQGKELVWCFSVFFEDEDEAADTLQIAAI